MYHTECLNNTDLRLWDEFIRDNNGGYFQSLLYYDLCLQLAEFNPLIIVTFKGNSIVGSILAVVQSSGSNVKKYFSRRAIIIGGPILKTGPADNQIVIQLLTGLNNQIRKKAVYTEFRNLFDLSKFNDEFKDQDFHYLDHLNVQLPLTNRESIQNKISSSKRRQIQKSLKNGVEIFQAVNLEDVRTFFDILTALYRSKVKKPLPSWDFFNKLYELSQDTDNIKFLLLRYKGEIIGGILSPIYNNTIYEWYIANKESYDKSIYPGVLATWAAIDYGINQNLKQFDFLGAGRANEEYGVRDFKLKFGGELVEHGRYIRINQPLLYRVGLIAMKINKRF